MSNVIDPSSRSVDDDPARRVEAEPGALADVLGREERVEHAVADLLGDARAVVGDVDACARPVALVS